MLLWKKSCTTWDVQNPVNTRINYLSTGAGFLPSTGCQVWEACNKLKAELPMFHKDLTSLQYREFVHFAAVRTLPPKKSTQQLKNPLHPPKKCRDLLVKWLEKSSSHMFPQKKRGEKWWFSSHGIESVKNHQLNKSRLWRWEKVDVSSLAQGKKHH